MLRARIALSALALAALPAFGQSVISTHSGLVYFFDGSVFIDGQQQEQKFGRFPDIGEGRELRTEHGRAEVLLTPGVFLRLGDNSSIRMLSNKLSDTRVELLGGSAILESNEATPDTSVKLIRKNWQVRVPQLGVYRINSEPPQVQVYKGEVEVATADGPAPVRVKEGETLPLATVLASEPSADGFGDPFKDWAMSRSQAIASDNAIAAEIVDDPAQMDTSTGLPVVGLSYFPVTGVPSLGITNPYGLSFWSPYQSMWSAIYTPAYLYGLMYRGWPSSVPYYPRPIGISTRIGAGYQPIGIYSPRSPITGPARPPVRTIGPAPHVGGHGGGQR